MQPVLRLKDSMLVAVRREILQGKGGCRRTSRWLLHQIKVEMGTRVRLQYIFADGLDLGVERRKYRITPRLSA